MQYRYDMIGILATRNPQYAMPYSALTNVEGDVE